MTIKTFAEAKPYAKAIFNLALEHNQILVWQNALKMLADFSIECEKYGLLDNHRLTAAQKIVFFAEIAGQFSMVANLVKLLAERKKLFLLPKIAISYHQLYLKYKNILEVKVISADKLTSIQEEQLLNLLKQRYQSEVLLQYYVDATLIGGAVIHIADKVIDGSIKGMLQRLKQNLLNKKLC